MTICGARTYSPKYDSKCTHTARFKVTSTWSGRMWYLCGVHVKQFQNNKQWEVERD